MRRALLCLCALLALAVPLAAESPSASLYHPGFKVDPDGLASGFAALYAVHNTSPDPVLVRAELYSTAGAYAGAYHFEIAGNGTATANLRDIFGGDGPTVCPGHFYTLSPAHLRDVLAAGSGLMRGYLHFQVVTTCSTLAPGEPGYEALAADLPVLIGDRFGLSVDSHYSQGALLVSQLCAGKHRVRFLRFPGDASGTEYTVFMPGAGGDTLLVPLAASAEGGEPLFPAINFAGGLRSGASTEVSLDWIGLDGFGSLEFSCPLPCAVSAVMHADGYAVSVPAVPLSCP